MNTRYLPGTGLARATGALCSVDGARAQADRSAPAESAACASAVRGPVAGQAVPGLAIEEQRLIEQRVALPVRQFSHLAVLPNAYRDQLKSLPTSAYA